MNHSGPLHYTSVSTLFCVLISAEQELPAQKTVFLRHHQMARHSLACVGSRQTVCLGTQTICSSPVSTSFPSIEALFTFFPRLLLSNSIQYVWVLGAAGGRICQVWLSSLDFRYFPFTFCFTLALFLFLFCWLGCQLRHLRKASAVGAWQWCTERLVQSHWCSNMDVFAWTALKVARNISQLVFSMHTKKKKKQGLIPNETFKGCFNI